MTKITLSPIADLTQSTTAAATINSNFSTIQTAFDNTLSRDGTIPDQMLSNLDMNGNQIINLPNPISANSALRLADLNSFIGGGTINTIPAGGTTGQALVKTSNTDYQVGWSTAASLALAGITITPTASTANQAILSNQFVAGSSLVSNSIAASVGSFDLNQIIINSDTASLANPAGLINGFSVLHNFGGSTVTGGRQAFYAQANLAAMDSPSNPSPDWVAGTFWSQTAINNGGTGVTAGTSRGGVWALNPVVVAYTGATNYNQIVGVEVNTTMQTGTSAYYKAGISITQNAGDKVGGSVFDAGLNFTNAVGAIGWSYGIAFSNGNGQQPIASTGTLIGTIGSSTIQNGIDFSSYTFNNYVLNSRNASITGLGAFISATIGGGTASNFYASSTAPSLGFKDTAGGTDQKVWDIIANGGNLLAFRTVNDANNTAVSWLTALRTGNQVTSVSIPKLSTDSFTTKDPFAITTTTYTVGTSDYSLICSATASCTLTLPSAASYTGRWLVIKNIAGFTVVSASSNVVPIASFTPGTAILPATPGKFVALQSDGANWNTMMGN